MLLVIMTTIMMTLVAVAWWRWNSRVKPEHVTFRSETYTLAVEPQIKEQDLPILHELNDEYIRVARLVEKVLVSIDTTGVTRVSELSKDGKSTVEKRMAVHGLGSGVIVSREGHIITAYHVIKNKHALRVTLNDGRSVSVRLVGVDPELDIAVLQIDNARMHFNPLPFADSDKVQPGMIVMACGNPYGLGASVSRGIISARERKLTESGLDLLQTDASIFPGNSGGPLINIRGEIVGINKSVLPGSEKDFSGIGFAIPSNLVRHSFQQICLHGRPMRGYLGLDIVPNSPQLRSYLNYNEAEGVIVNVVKSGSPAEQSGLKAGDVILSFNEVPVRDILDVQNRLENLTIGDKFRLKVWRKGQKMNINLKVGDSILQSVPSPWEDFMNSVGMHLRELTIEEQSIGACGLLVIQVDAAKSVGQILQAGDVVFAVNHQSICTMEELVRALNEGPTLLTVSRDGQQFNVKVDVRRISGQTTLPEVKEGVKVNAILPQEMKCRSS